MALFPEARANVGRLHQWKQNVQKTVCDKITQDYKTKMKKVMLKMLGECCLAFCLFTVVHDKHTTILTIFI